MAKRELWRRLKVGDRVRLVEFPPTFLRPNSHLHRDTIWVYKQLVARGRPLRVSRIEYGGPWLDCRFRRKGRLEYHSLLINHDGIVRVKPRVKKL